MTYRKSEHERRAKLEGQKVFLDRVRDSGSLPDVHSDDPCECGGSMCDCMDHRTIEALIVIKTGIRPATVLPALCLSLVWHRRRL